MRAVSHAQTILSWQENLASDEVPPEWMWPLDDELGEWFEDVKRERKERYGGSGDTEVPMTKNEMTPPKGRR